jgi:hypothetical protein
LRRAVFGDAPGDNTGLQKSLLNATAVFWSDRNQQSARRLRVE